MPEQLFLPEWGAPPPVTHGLFFSLFLDEITATRIAKLAQQLCMRHELQGRLLEPDRFHVSLYNLGEHLALPPRLVAAARAAAARVTLPPFRISFDRVMSFSGGSGSRVLVLGGGEGVVSVVSLAEAIAESMTNRPRSRRVNSQMMPHLTLAYCKRTIVEQAMEPISWTVREFCLVHSLRRKGRYIRLGQWPLRGQGTTLNAAVSSTT